MNEGSETRIVTPTGHWSLVTGHSVVTGHSPYATFDHATWFSGGDVTLYAFSHPSEFFPHAVLHRAGPVAELAVEAVDDPAVAELPVTTRIGEMSFDAYVRHPESGVDGVVVLRGGRIIYESYPRMQPWDQHILMSVSKAYASTLIAILEARGLVDIDRPVETYIPELRGSGWEGVSVRDINDMASGIDAREHDPDAYSDTSHPYYDYEASIGTIPATERTPWSTYAYTAALKSARPAGEAFEYTSVDTFVLGWVCEAVTGLSFSDLLSREIWSKIGAESDGLMRVSRAGAAAADGGIAATLRDVARFGLLFTPSWRTVASEPVLPAGLVERIQQEGRREMYLAGSGEHFSAPYGDDPPLYNAWQWDSVWADGDFHKGGMGGQGLHVSPSRDVVVAFFGAPVAQRRPNQLNALSRQVARGL
jgi:CubicO group peptidase (beta-lactamase class C family)